MLHLKIVHYFAIINYLIIEKMDCITDSFSILTKGFFKACFSRHSHNCVKNVVTLEQVLNKHKQNYAMIAATNCQEYAKTEVEINLHEIKNNFTK